MKRQLSMRSKVNGLIIPVPGFARGVMPRFGIEDNKLVFEQSEDTRSKLDDSVGNLGNVLPQAQLDNDEANELEELRALRAEFERQQNETIHITLDAQEEPEMTEAEEAASPRAEATPQQKAAATRAANRAAKAAKAAAEEAGDDLA